jgi:hypothetical protein
MPVQNLDLYQFLQYPIFLKLHLSIINPPLKKKHENTKTANRATAANNPYSAGTVSRANIPINGPLTQEI